jgi:HSP20 family protein
MEETTGKDLQAKKKTEIQSSAEQTRPGLLFIPAVDIFETEKALTLLADMPGVNPDDISIDLKDNILTLIGDVKSPQKDEEVDIYREYQTGKYYRQFTLSEMIDQTKIEGSLKDGVLSLVLPKVEKTGPRKITINTTG